MLKRLQQFRSPDPAEGTPSPAPPAPPSDPKEKGQEPPLPPNPPAPNPAPPITAKAVIEGTKTERELALEQKLTERERRVAELEDENRTLKTPQTPPKAPPAREKKHFLDGGTFFD